MAEDSAIKNIERVHELIKEGKHTINQIRDMLDFPPVIGGDKLCHLDVIGQTISASIVGEE